MPKVIRRLVVAASLAVAAAGPQPSIGQRPTASTAVPVGREVIRIPCCRCVNGPRRTVTINTGTARWRVATPNSTSFQPAAAVVPPNPAWTPVPPAAWVGPPGAAQTVGDYTYRLQFYVPRCMLRPIITISGRFAADNSARLLLDGVAVASSQGTAGYGFLPGSVTPFSASATSPGLHELTIVVTNSSGPTAVAIQGAITIACPRELEDRGRQDEAAPVQLPAVERPDADGPNS